MFALSALSGLCSLSRFAVGPSNALDTRSAWGGRSRPALCSLVRLDKLLADRGAGSRKQVSELIRSGEVQLDGEVVGKAGANLKVPEGACPTVGGVPYPPLPLLVAYHKPVGVHSTMSDQLGRPSLATVLPAAWRSLHPIGRLDADTSGLLLFSSDGDLTHRLLHPKYAVEREYVATVEHAVDAEALGRRLAEGVATIEDGAPLVVIGRLLRVSGADVRLVVTEGKHRMVRRMLANCGHPVLELRRERYGAVWLGELAQGHAVEVGGVPRAWADGMLAAAGTRSRVAAASIDACKPERLHGAGAGLADDSDKE